MGCQALAVVVDASGLYGRGEIIRELAVRDAPAVPLEHKPLGVPPLPPGGVEVSECLDILRAERERPAPRSRLERHALAPVLGVHLPLDGDLPCLAVDVGPNEPTKL